MQVFIVIRDNMETGLGLIQECENSFYFLVQLTERGVLNPLNEKRKTTFDRGKKRKKKGDEKQEEIKLTSTKHLPQRGGWRQNS